MMLKDFFTRKKYGTINMEEVKKADNIPNNILETNKPVKRIDTSYDKVEDSKMSPRERIESIIDKNTFSEYDIELKNSDPLKFPGYEEKILKAMEQSKENEAVITGEGEINVEKVIICVMNPNFMMGSMGSVVGEKVTRAIERAIDKKSPLIIFSASGGARMQEGIISLMQMAKTSGALGKLDKEGILYISVLTNPTTGGVTASFAMLGDIIISEPKALICFAGPRVIEQTIRQKLPEGFQRAEFLLEKGFIDMIVKREEMKDTLSKILKIHSAGGGKNE